MINLGQVIVSKEIWKKVLIRYLFDIISTNYLLTSPKSFLLGEQHH